MRPESLFFLFSPVTRVKSVGATAAKALAKLLPAATVASGGGLPIVRDLLFHLPVGLIDRSFTCPLNQAPEGKICTFVVRVDTHVPPPARRGSKRPYRVVCSNDTGEITLVFFHARDDYVTQSLPEGSMRAISGRVEYFDYMLQMTHPDIIAPADKIDEVMRPDPVYPLTVGMTSRRIGKLVESVIEKLPELPEWIGTSPSPLVGEGRGEGVSYEKISSKRPPLSLTLPHKGGGEYFWPSWKEALTQVHHPQSETELSPDAPMRMRLAYDEMLALQLNLALLRRKTQQQPGIKISGTGALTEKLVASLPFVLTAGQQQVLKEIAGDMSSGGRMVRLLQGDVGSGKTIVALLAILRAVEEGHQAALMVPTELIAQQHYEVISKLLEGGGLRVVLLTGSVKGKARERALAEIESGEAQIVIGTQALFQEHVEFKNLALAVIDEQQRFGVSQRMAIAAKGDSPHILQLTATPIPRSLSMTIYGDMDISQLTEKPAGRQKITTRVIPLSRYGEIMERLKAALDRGEKAYWICPLIDEKFVEGELELTPEQDIAAAQSRFTEFRARFGERVGLAHGRMKSDECQTAMRNFAEGKTRLLVATTVVEVGMDVRDATIIIIEKAERFGLAQLHQLRGRIGRSDKPSACLLLRSEWVAKGIDDILRDPSAPDPYTHRLSILRDSDDGFKIAEADLSQRGGGDLLGVRQSGLPRFIFTDLFRHQHLLTQARDEVKEILASGQWATDSERGRALRLLLQLFGYETGLSDA